MEHNDANREFVETMAATRERVVTSGPAGLGLLVHSLLLLIAGSSPAADRNPFVAKLVATLDGARGPCSVVFSPDGRTLAAGGPDGSILWEVASGGVRARFKTEGIYGSLSFAPDGKRLVAANNEAVQLQELATGKSRVLGKPGFLVQQVAFSPDGKVVAASGGGFCIDLMDVATGKRQAHRETKAPIMGNLAFSPDGSLLAVAGETEDETSGLVLLWDARSRRLRSSLRGGKEKIHALAFSPDGSTLVASSYGAYRSGTLYFWEVKTGKLLQTRTAGIRSVFSIAFSPDGRILAVAGKNSKRVEGTQAPGQVKFWSTATGKELGTLNAHQDSISGIAFSPNGKLLAVTCDTETVVNLWNVSGLTRPATDRILPVPAQKPSVPVRRVPAGKGGLQPEELKRLWVDLASKDAKQGYRAMWRLATAPGQSISFLKNHLKSVVLQGQERARQLVANLDSDELRVREKAARELATLGEAAELALRRCLAEKPSPECRKRAGLLLKKLAAWSPEQIQTLRAIESLEYMGTPDARAILVKLAKGASEARLTQEARASLERLARRRPRE